MAKKIALIMGGMGAERDVSLVTGKAFAKALDELKMSHEVIEAGPDLPARLLAMKPDVALLALHGKYGEDGTVQGLCEYLKIPYSGSGVMASALCMNKYYSKQILRFHDLPTPRFEMFFADSAADSRDGKSSVAVEKFSPNLGWPIVVKPSREGSTVGISIVKTSAELPAALKLALQYDQEVLIEEFIPGAEMTVAVFDGRALTPIEISPKQGFYDYKNKYTAGNTDYILPPRVDAAIIKKCQDLALRAHQALQCRVYSRVDFRLAKDGSPYILELNTLPGCTPTSLLPKAAAYDGISFTQLIRTLVEKASLDYEGVR
ncbi:MAG: D-alanine--D-alanine ligase [Bdellovibrionales bacterium]